MKNKSEPPRRIERVRRILCVDATMITNEGTLLFLVEGARMPQGFVWYDNEDFSALTPEAQRFIERLKARTP